MSNPVKADDSIVLGHDNDDVETPLLAEAVVPDDECVQVCAPANLASGYELAVEVNGETWVVQVVRPPA
jgi:hypothetical protein